MGQALEWIGCDCAVLDAAADSDWGQFVGQCVAELVILRVEHRIQGLACGHEYLGQSAPPVTGGERR